MDIVIKSCRDCRFYMAIEQGAPLCPLVEGMIAYTGIQRKRFNKNPLDPRVWPVPSSLQCAPVRRNNTDAAQ